MRSRVYGERHQDMLAVGQSLAVREMYPSKHGLMKYKAVLS